MSTAYTATAAREGRWWAITVPGVDGVTQTRRLGDAADMARELVAVTLGVPLEDVVVEVTVTAVDDIDVAGDAARIRSDRQKAAALEVSAADGARSLARRLVDADVPLRDVGRILGVSHQRAHQLVHSGEGGSQYEIRRTDVRKAARRRSPAA
ncbi:HicB family toxin-antitoxin system [Cellulomonas soli]|uniref:HicB family toxin-antitoxin system n=1 Tax=Cellulomonas soli TaxID=931535 RepID=A0A512PFB0_9CELL|nr:HicB family toxin-antitoxin system [Cellulomonas soli]NYI59378.1 hypothetical protein [Cellulomonas soli]GEP69832.1 hypothetical protein CSO01_25470 [Cellulomonas soli]